ncbi:hypothetical protein D3C72_1758720 [compost metagenome]
MNIGYTAGSTAWIMSLSRWANAAAPTMRIAKPCGAGALAGASGIAAGAGGVGVWGVMDGIERGAVGGIRRWRRVADRRWEGRATA